MRKLILTLLFTPLTCFAFGGSNLDVMGYPEFDEIKPIQPYSNDEYSRANYRNEVEEYIRKSKEYVDNANDDIDSIQNAKNNAINKANQVIQEYNSSNF